LQVTTGFVLVAPATRHSAKQSVFAGPPPRSAGPVVVLVVVPPPLVVVEVLELVVTPVLVVVDVTAVQAPRSPTSLILFVGAGVVRAKSLSNAAPPTRVRLCAPVFGVLEVGALVVTAEYGPYATQST